MEYSNVGGVHPSAPPQNPAYQPEHSSSGLSSTIATIAIIAFSLIAAAAVDYDAPPLAFMLRIVAGTAGLVWLFSRIRGHRQGGGYHQPYQSYSQPSVIVVEAPRRRNSWSSGFGLGNFFGLGSQPMYAAPPTRYAQQHQQPSHHGVPPAARASAQSYGGQTMYVAQETRGTGRPSLTVYQQSPQGSYGGHGVPPVARAPAQQGGQPMHVAPQTRAPAGSVYPSAASYQAPAYHPAPPGAYSAPPQNHGGNPGSQPMYQAAKDRNK